MKIIIILLCVLSTGISLKAKEFKTNKSCFNVTLMGGAIDTSSCTTTFLKLIETKCGSLQRVASTKVEAKLKACKVNSAQGSFEYKQEKVKFSAAKTVANGVELWQVSQLQKIRPKKTVKTLKTLSTETAAADIKPMRRELISISRGVHSNLAVELYADVNMSINANSPNIGSSTSFATTNNALRVNDSKDSQLALGLLNLRILYNKDNISLLVDIADGSSIPGLLSSPEGALMFSSMQALQALMTYDLDAKNKMTVGRFKSPFFKSDQRAANNTLYSFSLLESMGVPKFHSGVTYSKNDIWGLNVKGYLVNGWNQYSDNNKALSLGGQAKYVWNKKFKFDVDLYLGNESSATSAVRMLGQITGYYKQSNKLELMFQLLAGSTDSEVVDSQMITSGLWYAGLVEANYKTSNTRSWGLRVENFYATEGFLTGAIAPKDYLSAAVNVKETLKSGIKVFSEARFDNTNKVFYNKGLTATDSQATILVGASMDI